MRFSVMLKNSAGAIANEIVELRDGADLEDRVSDKIQGVIDTWILSVGDTIEIRELSGA